MRLRDLILAHVLYDTIEVPFPTEPRYKYTLFRDLMGKTREQTNFDLPLRLHTGEEFRLDSVLVKTNEECLWSTARLVLRADDRTVFNRPLSHFRTPYMDYAKFEDNTDIRGYILMTGSVFGTGHAAVRVELHGALAKPVPKDWRPDP